MPLPLLTTKLSIPPLRRDLIARPHLLEYLNNNQNSRLILVNAPAGYGKSTIISAWAQKYKSEITWFAIDKGDNDFALFLAYLITAIQKLYPGFGQPILNTITESGDIEQSHILTAILNELTNLTHSMTLVFDDYHLIENQEIHSAVIFLLDHLPETIKLMIISRAEPPFPLHRWRGRGELTEIRATDLRFTVEEAQEFLNSVMGLVLNPSDVQTLEARTEGWITGLQMAALAIQALPARTNEEQAAVSNFVRAFSSSHRYILDYLRDEVINNQSPEVQRFLLQTSILERMTASLCNMVLQINNSQEILEYLENQNLFLISLDGERHWYRYHHLFAELLETNLHEKDADSISKLHIRASQWYAQNKDGGQAIAHALASGQTKVVYALTDALLLEAYENGDLEQSRHWLHQLPIEMIRCHPLLCMANSIASTYTHHFDYARAENWAAQAQKTNTALLDQPIDRIGIPYDTIGELVGAYAARLQVTMLRLSGATPEEILQAAKRALADTPEDDYAACSSMWMAISRAHLSLGEAAAAEDAIQQAIALSELSGRQNIIVSALWTQAYIAYWQGRLQSTLKIYQRAYNEYISPVEQRGEYISSSGVLYTFWATVLREMNRIEEAKELFQKSQNLARFRDLADTALDNEIGLAWIAAYKGEDNGIKALEKRLPDLPSKKVEMVQRHTTSMKILLGDRQPEWANSAFQWTGEQVVRLKPLDQLESLYLIWVRALLLRKRWGKPVPDLRDVLVSLDAQQHLAEASHFLRSQIQCLITKAMVYQALRERDKAVQSLSAALRLAQPEGYVRIFINERAPIAPLLQAAIKQGIALDYAQELLEALKVEIQNLDVSQSIIEPLTPREVDVLKLVAVGLSNREIAEQLVLAPGTVKKYLSSVFQKLNVNRRTQAVARAKDLGILA